MRQVTTLETAVPAPALTCPDANAAALPGGLAGTPAPPAWTSLSRRGRSRRWPSEPTVSTRAPAKSEVAPAASAGDAGPS